MKKIKAAVLDGINENFKIEKIQINYQLSPHDVRVHIVASGICHTDEAVRNVQGEIFHFQLF